MASSTTNYWKLGLFVVLGVMGIVSALVWVGASRLQREVIEAHTFFDEKVTGLDPGAPLKFRGVTIGKVSRIRIAQDRRHVHVVSSVYVDSLQDLGLRPNDDDLPVEGQGPFVEDDLRIQIVTSILTGIAILEADYFDLERYPVPEYPFEVPWNTVHPVPSTILTFEAGMLRVLERLPDLVDEARSLLTTLEQNVDEMKLGDLSQDVRELTEALEQRVENLESLGIVKQGTATLAEIEHAVEVVADTLEELRHETGPLFRMLKRYDDLGADLQVAVKESDVPGTLESLRNLSGRTGDGADDLGLLSRQLRRDLDGLGATIEAIRRLAELLERDPSSLIRGRASASTARD